MMDIKKEVIDPDYMSFNSALEQSEEEDKRENMIKLRKIIEEEFNKEIAQRQEQVEQIEQQIFKVRKLLHLLRYVLIMSYYKKKELEYNEEEPSTSLAFTEIDTQNRIHPALKKLLGDNIHNLKNFQIKDKRKTVSRTPLPTPIDKKSDKQSPPNKKLKLVEDTSRAVEPTVSSTRNRKKNKHRLIIGNTSQYITNSAAENLTHKWMVYVRGPKESPNISHIVEKVVFYLHPSYKPYDVVEIGESPFHLSRRGWGEFPIRVQIFFKVELNKPIDVIHNIVLDKTYSGKQMLGKETLVDVFLYDSNTILSVNEEGTQKIHQNSSQIDITNIKLEPRMTIKSENEISETELIENIALFVPKPEHDYCEFQEDRDIFYEHSYSLLSEDLPKPLKETILQDESNSLIYGLSSYYGSVNRVSQNAVRKIPITNRIVHDVQKIIENSHLVQMQYKVTIPKNRFKNMGEALVYSFKKLPLFSDLARNVYYKRMYPFTAVSLQEFRSWNIGKRRSSEWSRALEIKHLLKSVNICGIEKWSLKSIVMFGRSHAFTPCVNYASFVKQSEEKNLLFSCYLHSSIREKFVPTKCEENVTVNVDLMIDNSKKDKLQKPIDMKDFRLQEECNFIHDTVLKCGIILRDEEIEPGVIFNGAERMILESMKSFAENLIRRAKHHRICSYPNSGFIEIEHVRKALEDRPEMKALERFKQQKKTMDFFS